jgi:hypothetical protein
MTPEDNNRILIYIKDNSPLTITHGIPDQVLSILIDYAVSGYKKIHPELGIGELKEEIDKLKNDLRFSDALKNDLAAKISNALNILDVSREEFEESFGDLRWFVSVVVDQKKELRSALQSLFDDYSIVSDMGNNDAGQKALSVLELTK